MTYEWALSALKRLAPGWTPDVMVTDEDAALSAAIRNQMSPSLAIILCQWHIRQNMQKHARKHLLDQDQYELMMSDFDEIRDARTVDQLNDARDAFLEHWQHSYPQLCDYLDEKLSAEHLWVAAYINRHPHMGTKVTSRAEGAHATLKNWLHSRHGNLFTVTQALKNHFIVQQNQILSDLENDRAKIPVTILGDPFYVQVARTASRYALNLIKQQDEMSRRPSNVLADNELPEIITCSCIITITLGLPCMHQLAKLRAIGKSIPLNWIHPQWRTASDLPHVQVARLLDPLLPQQRKNLARVTSSGRMMTGNEIAEQNFQRKVRRCKNCHQAGHNSSKCLLPCGRCKGDHQLGQCPL
ncbi:hypothetical protein A4X09_0g5901 [Tilletia walkeri]|uniref:SWIM-type domain-containing protein n=1 Tax=Tilletia walkeri TaxID=117179 RepID=A0A8X7N3N1_9BASI|nr:hypothetical protein A4X09_0g5901 [Tilletia walkeri]